MGVRAIFRCSATVRQMIDGVADDFTVILAAAQAGDDRAIAQLFTGIHPRLRRFMWSAEPRFADDLAGEVWEAVARGLRSFNGGESDLRAWIFTIARRRIVEHRRRATRRKTEPVDDAFFVQMVSNEEPERVVVDTMAATDIVELVKTLLSADQAEVVLLRVLGDLDAAQVAAIVGRSENWVRVTQHRALRKLADRVTAKMGVTR